MIDLRDWRPACCSYPCLLEPFQGVEEEDRVEVLLLDAVVHVVLAQQLLASTPSAPCREVDGPQTTCDVKGEGGRGAHAVMRRNMV